MPIQIFGSLAVQIACMILLGFILKKTSIINIETQKGISHLLLTAILPVSILESALEEAWRPDVKDLLQSIILISAYYILSILVSRRISQKVAAEDGLRKLFVNLSVFANVGFIGFALMEAFFGSAASIFVVIYNLEYQIFLALYAIRMISGKKELNLPELILDPMNLASFAAIFLFFVPIKISPVFMHTMSSIGGMVVPLSMIIIGCQLADVRIRELVRDRMAWVVSFLRLIVFPLLMLIICRLLCLDEILVSTLVILTGLPSGSLNSILAEKYHCYPREAAITVVESTVLMVATLPVLILLLQIS